MKTLRNLAEHFEKLPGIGPKTALRMAHHILFSMPKPEAESFAAAIRESLESLKLCQVCFSIADQDQCAICRNPNRHADEILIVADVRDLLAVEETGIYKGRYHVLGGLISPMNRVGPGRLRIEELKRRVEPGGIREVILGTVLTAEGEITAHYLTDQLKPYGVKISRISAGIPVGGTLEYMDSMTVTKALLNRQEMNAAPA